jgi:carbamoylphosphate synthase large subunit
MNILFTGIGGPTPLGLAKSVKKAFPDSRCIGVDGSKWAANLYHSDIFDASYQIVLASHSNYWQVIRNIIEKEHIDFAFIGPETEKLVWSKLQSKDKLPCQALIQDYKLALFCFDKLKVAQYLYEFNLAPQTSKLNIGENIPLNFPFWIRVKSGAGALGALKINNQKDLDTWLTIHDYRNDFMISEFLPGRNYACKMLYFNGKLIQNASAERIDYLLSAAAPSGISGMCARGKLLNRNDLVEKSKQALEAISQKLNKKLHGMFTIDFKENKEGVPLITEINIRHVSFNYAFTLGGINFAETTLRMALNIDLVSKIPTSFHSEDFFIRGVDAPIRLIDSNLI